VQVVLAVACLAVLHQLGLLGRLPLWVVLLPPVVGGAGYRILASLAGRWPPLWQLHVRLGWRTTAVTAMLYLTGWGPALAVVLIVVAVEHLADFGPAAWRAISGWALADIVGGQLVVGFRLVPTNLPTHASHGLALMICLSLVFIIRHLGQSSHELTERGQQRSAAQAALSAAQHRFDELVRHAADVVLVVDGEGRIDYASGNTAAFAPQDQPLTGRDITTLLDPAEQPRWRAAFELAVQHGIQFEDEFSAARRGGTCRWWRVTCRNLLYEPDVAGMLLNCREVTEEHAAHEELEYRAYHDLLTGLPNRAAFHRALEKLDGLTTEETALLFIDVDSFKMINDRFGHHVGDSVLQAVAGRLQAATRTEDLVCRLAGDEFTVLMCGPRAHAVAPRVAARITESMRDVITTEGGGIAVSVSIGVAIATGEAGAALLERADESMYREKRQRASAQ
jgi:diguanylate cyclase (GGDEF)-like protein/PAS domain S-box-containing protein